MQTSFPPPSPVRIFPREELDRVQRLVNVASQMKEPGYSNRPLFRLDRLARDPCFSAMAVRMLTCSGGLFLTLSLRVGMAS
jgi:hypothetical protein